ncbi:hypothetical protein PRUPE_1G416800 [Prunus persica]|uniref:Uncharacterized protein n=1 Tax=Prunus persica TaxID=3760 RepID=M5XFE8_PRUPE|nr:homeobox-leucine zipper protein HAT22 [Prunus persica]ONI33323.1 hypothetical protein PRUPE_1G416800 [Prunus persica]
MSFDEACNTGLGLSLGCRDSPDHDHTNLQAPPDHHHHHHQNTYKNKQIQLKYDHLLPSLTLGPSAASKIEEAESTDLHQAVAAQEQDSSPCSGAFSSFSNSSSFKRDRELGGEEIEVEVEVEVEVEEERVVNITSSRASEELYEQDHEGSPRKKLRLSKEQSATLEDSFREHTTLNPKQKQDLARKLNLRPRQVEVWFQNRRARTKLKQTEADCELLKKCCETLKEENRRLHKELQELKLMKQTATAAAAVPPFYMQFPTATLTMCPSCEKICNGGDHHNHHGSSTSSFLIGSKPAHLIFNPFSTHPSTAC